MNQRHAQQKDQDSMLDTYMRDVSRYKLLTAADERELGARLIEKRTNYWLQTVSYAPYASAVCDFLEKLMDELPNSFSALFEEVRFAARSARDSNRKSAADRFQTAISALAGRLAAADPECIGADQVAADLEVLTAQGSSSSVLKVRPPRRESRPFDEYVSRIRRAGASLRVIRNRFAEANLRLVVRIANRFQRTGLTLHDRVQEGNLGLMKAVDRFDPARGFRFSTYATWWIKHAIRRAVVNRGRTIRLPAHLQAVAGKIAQARKELGVELEREPTNEELAEALAMHVDKVALVVSAIGQRSLSLDAQIGEDEDRSIADVLPDDDSVAPDEVIAADWDVRRMQGQLLALSPMERDILSQRFGLNGADERTLTEIGGQYSLSRERIRQLQQKALHRMRARLDPQTSSPGYAEA